MLKYLHLKNVGLAPDLRVEWAPRLNLITGDNGLGKSFLLDLAWWALTRTWAGSVALPPISGKSPQIEYVVQGKAGQAKPVVSKFRRSDETWRWWSSALEIRLATTSMKPTSSASKTRSSAECTPSTP